MTTGRTVYCAVSVTTTATAALSARQTVVIDLTLVTVTADYVRQTVALAAYRITVECRVALSSVRITIACLNICSQYLRKST